VLVQGTIPAPSPCNRLPQDAENAQPLGGATTSQPGSRNLSQNQIIWRFTSPEMSAVTGKLLSPGTRAGYAADWALFTDWCAATGHTPLPADFATISAFAAACPAAPATQRRRLGALRHHHRICGYQLPVDDRSAVAVPTRVPINPGQVELAMRLLSSRGWVGGLFGRRDRALLTLAAHTPIPYRQIAGLTVGHLQIVDGGATITDRYGAQHLVESDESRCCAGRAHWCGGVACWTSPSR